MKYGEFNMGQAEALLNKIGGMDGMNKILSGEWTIDTSPATQNAEDVRLDLLKVVGTPVLFSRIIRFVARDKFKVTRKSEVPISFLSTDFKENFLDVVENQVRHCTLRQRELLKPSLDGSIISALGGEDKAKIALASAYEFLKTADRKLWYIFYIADKTGKVWGVGASWDDDGWGLAARPFFNLVGWVGGGMIVSR